jgi:hypothetical protein
VRTYVNHGKLMSSSGELISTQIMDHKEAMGPVCKRRDAAI